MTENSAEPAAESSAPEPARTPSTFDEERSFPRGLVVRLFAYLVAGHLFAGFLYLLFRMGAQGR